MKSYQTLMQIGLTKSAAKTYLALYESRQHIAEAGALAKQLRISRVSVYRALHQLEAYGFVHKTKIIGAAHFRAQPLNHALVSYADWQSEQVQDLLIQQLR